MGQVVNTHVFNTYCNNNGLNKVYRDNARYWHSDSSMANEQIMCECWNRNILDIPCLYNLTVPNPSGGPISSQKKSIKFSFLSGNRLLTTDRLGTENLTMQDLTICRDASNFPISLYAEDPTYANNNLPYFPDIAWGYFPQGGNYGSYGELQDVYLGGQYIQMKNGFFCWPPLFYDVWLRSTVSTYYCSHPPNLYGGDPNCQFGLPCIKIDYYNSWIGSTLGGANSSISSSSVTVTGIGELGISESSFASHCSTAQSNYLSVMNSLYSGSKIRIEYVHMKPYGYYNSISDTSSRLDSVIEHKVTGTYWTYTNLPTIEDSYIQSVWDNQYEDTWGMSSDMVSNKYWRVRINDGANTAVYHIIQGLSSVWSAYLDGFNMDNVIVLHEIYVLHGSEFTSNQKVRFFETIYGGSSSNWTPEGEFPIIVRSYIFFCSTVHLYGDQWEQPSAYYYYWPWGITLDLTNSIPKYPSYNDLDYYAVCNNWVVNSTSFNEDEHEYGNGTSYNVSQPYEYYLQLWYHD